MAPADLALHSARPDSRPSPVNRTRSQSMSSDRPSLTGSYAGGLQSPPSTVSPDPTFIAASAASQIVTNDHDSQSEMWFDQHGIEPSGETALVAPGALKLVNRFLDQLLFSFLSVSKATTLASLRPAVSEVLKPKLAKEAINGADQELYEYLGGGDDQEMYYNGQNQGTEWDLELVWKRTRLRCMVYSSLGDMEEEDEDFYTEQDHLDGPSRFDNDAGVVSPAVAIFLTSILEFMGEHVLVIAGQAAYHRLRNKHEKEEREGTNTPADIADRVVVEEADMERVALDRTIGRLWRGWKKRVRSPTTSISMTRSFSRESINSMAQGNHVVGIAPEDDIDEDARRPSLATVLNEREYAARIPLPVGDNDIREIEIPGLAYQSDDDEQETTSEDDFIKAPTRPKSLLIFTQFDPDLPTPISQNDTPIYHTAKSRKRSHSLPTPAASPYQSPKKSRTGKSQVEQAHGDNGAANGTETESETNNHSVDTPIPNGEVKEPEERSGLVAGLIAGAAAMGGAAVAGITAAAKGEAPQTSMERTTDYDEEFTEEPQIMTSSRISIGGRISPDEVAAPSRRSSIRSHSVHSLRVIDVASPRTPSASRTPSVDTSMARSVSLTRSRPNSIHSPTIVDLVPRVASPVSRTLAASPLVRNPSSLSSRQARNSAEESISEVEESQTYDESPPMTAVPSDLAAAMSGVDFYPSPTSQQFTPSEPMSREFTPKAPKTHKPQPFVLSQPPPPRNAARIKKQAISEPQTQSLSANTMLESRTPSTGSSPAPPLTPLREAQEGVVSTSDSGSNYDTRSLSHGVRSVSDHTGSAHSPAASSSSLSQSHRKAVPQPNGFRSSPPRQSMESLPRKELPKNSKALHTSGSSTSSSQKLHRVQTTDDTPRATDDKGRSFEQLIRSDETIQYTLTPQNMRNIEYPESPESVKAIVKPQEVPRPMTGRSHSSSVSKYTAPRPVETPKSAKSSKQFPPLSRPASNTGATVRSNASRARDPRVERESMNDFAEFIKSTGPTNTFQPPARAGTTNTFGPANSKATSHRVTNSLAQAKSISNTRNNSAAKLPQRSASTIGRARLQAREAVVPRDDSISDLIDFVRSGPQLDKNSHRIPRTVAPFRTTMDSDQMAGAIGGKAIDASLPDPRYSQASASVNSSVGSQSALLSKSNKSVQAQRSNEFDEEEDMMPVRKQRRVRDMYQIDFSDEEEEYEALTAPRARPAVKEESLADFLRDVPPPPDSSPQPIYTASAVAANKKLKKKSSTSGFMSRFSRDNGSSSNLPPKPKSSGNDSRTSSSRGNVPPMPTHTPIAVQLSSNYKPATYEPARGGGNYVSSARNIDPPRGKVAQKSYQPREAVYTNTQTSDLASFLRDSEPPPSHYTQPQQFSPVQRETSGFGRMFGRKKA